TTLTGSNSQESIRDTTTQTDIKYTIDSNEALCPYKKYTALDSGQFRSYF
ncbi:hypothetical protein BB560_005537, partial [Smittium megazygosporum]